MAQSLQLIEQSIRHQVMLERVKSKEANQYASFLLDMDRSIRLRLSADDLTEFSRVRLERLIASIESDMSLIYDNYWNDLSGSLAEIGEYEAAFESKSLNQVLESFETVAPGVEQVRAAVFTRPLSVSGHDGGKLLESFYRDWTTTEKNRVTGAVRKGYFEGKTNSQMIKDIRGTKANNYRDGLLAINKRNADAVVRTSVQHTASMAQQATWEANSNVVIGVRWISTLDARTTQVCRSLDQTVYPLKSGPRPPIHIGCRSRTVAELDGRFKFLEKGATRSSMSGPVGASQSYYSWLKSQPASFQDAAIGKSRGKLLRSGGLSSKRFAELNIGRNFAPLTLADMKKLEPLAFSRANL